MSPYKLNSPRAWPGSGNSTCSVAGLCHPVIVCAGIERVQFSGHLIKIRENEGKKERRKEKTKKTFLRSTKLSGTRTNGKTIRKDDSKNVWQDNLHPISS